MYTLPEKAKWESVKAQLKTTLPEMFSGDDVLNLIHGKWTDTGNKKSIVTPVDGSLLGYLPMLSLEQGKEAVVFSQKQFEEWRHVDLGIRIKKVQNVLASYKKHAELFAMLLSWEIGKPYHQSMVSVERCITGVEWYIENIESMLDGRNPLGVVSNIASWNYPMSVLVHAVLVQVLSGNSAISKTPTDGGLFTLSLAFGLAHREGLPVSLVSGSGSALSDALIRNQNINCFSYVGGRSNGRDIASLLVDENKRYMLEMEGLNTYGIWEFSNWKLLSEFIKKGFEYGKQRCTAYPRFIVQRKLFPQFLETYLSTVKTIKVGHPLLANEKGEFVKIDFGPLINSKKIEELNLQYNEALLKGGVGIMDMSFDESLFLPHQDRSAYITPKCVLNIPRGTPLYYNEPFGPIDSIVVMDSIEQMVAEMNVSNGNLVSSIFMDNEEFAKKIATEIRAFKVGVNKIRSRGDKEEHFGGVGQSWKGCFVGGKLLVTAITKGNTGEQLVGNFPSYQMGV